MDADRFAASLKSAIRGDVRFDDSARALYATDSSNYRQVPIGVVLPREEEDVIRTVELCRNEGIPILGRGCGTSLAGQCCNVAVVLDFSRYMNQIVEVNPEARLAKVQPGVILDHLRNAAEKHHLTFGPDPATHNRCTLGGMIGNNSCGVHSVLSGKTVDNLESLRILTYDGQQMSVGKTSESELQQILAGNDRRAQIYAGLKSIRDRYASQIRERFPQIPRRVSGYNLDQLLPENGFDVARALVGTESTCVLVLEATVQLIHSPQSRCLVVLGFASIEAAASAVPEILRWKPIGLEGLDDRLVNDCERKNLNMDGVALLPEGKGWLLVEFGSDTMEESSSHAQEFLQSIQKGAHAPDGRLFTDRFQQSLLWNVRESGLGASAFVPGQQPTWEGWEDAAVPPENLGRYLPEFRALLDRYNYRGVFYGHFGDGCVHTRISFDLQSTKGIQRFRSFLFEAAELVVKFGGSLSGEHGDGQSRGELLPIMFGKELVDAFREFKSLWDPQGKMNPGKVVDAYKVDENLRLGSSYQPAKPETTFSFQQDGGRFDQTLLRCVGVGKCRRVEGGVMCPSFMATREEEHSPRGRTHLLFEMMQGGVIRNGWKSEEVKHALDLCLACKGCKTECPVNVDVATYKAEFLSHYYEGKLRPLSAYAFGRVNVWASLGSRMPGLVNALLENRFSSSIMKSLSGVAPARTFPTLARQTFRRWFESRPPARETRNSVLLWPDTFNNYFRPEVAIAAVEVLEANGFHVLLPSPGLCCGRPLYDFGMLEQAKTQLKEILQDLKTHAGIPMVGLEPSCVAVFRDELPALFPENPDAFAWSRNVFTLSEFFMKRLEHPLPRMQGQLLLHGHCHHRSVLDWESEVRIAQGLGMDCQVVDSGCCGMAGSFGFEKEHYEISMQIGERVLLPAVRNASHQTLIVADGFSCREQIAQGTRRRALHLAEVLNLAVRK